MKKKYGDFLTRGLPLLSVAGFICLFYFLSQDGLRTNEEEFIYKPYPAELPQCKKIALESKQIFCEPSVKDAKDWNYTLTLGLTDSDFFARTNVLYLQLFPLESLDGILSAELILRDKPEGQVIGKFVFVSAKAYGGGFRIKLKNTEQISSFSGISSAELVVSTLSGVPLALTSLPVSDLPEGPHLFLEAPPSLSTEKYLLLEGSFRLGADFFPKYSRAQLLAEMWGIGVSRSWLIYAVFALAALIWLGGVLLLTLSTAVHQTHLSKAVPIAGIPLLLLSLFTVYAFITPPFQGQDEADHFLAFSSLNQNPQWAEDALVLANRGQFERIKRRSQEKFCSSSVNNPRKDSWAHYIQAPPAGRSQLGDIIWRSIGYIAPKAHAGMALLSVRWCSGLLVAATILMCSACLFRAGGPNSLVIWSALPALFVPSVDFIAVMVSNYPFLLAGYLIQSMSFGMLWYFLSATHAMPKIPPKAFFLAGAGAAVSICSGDNGLVGLLFWIFVLPGYQIADSLRHEAKDFFLLKPALFSTIYFSLGFVIVCVLVNLFSQQGEFLPSALLAYLNAENTLLPESFSLSYVFVACYLVALGILACIMRLIFARVYLKVWPSRVFPLLMILLLLGVIWILLSGSNPVRSIQDYTLIEYIAAVVHAFMDSLFPGNMDMMTVETFWRRLGWLDTWLPIPLVEFIRTATGLGICLLLISCFKNRKHIACSAFALVSLVALLGSVGAVAAIYHKAGFDVTNRYIAVSFIFAIVLSGEGFRRALGSESSKKQVHIAITALCMLIITVQTSAWIAIADRFVGKPRIINMQYSKSP